jgi:competence protein ComEA
VPGLRRRRIAPEEILAARARLDAVSQEWLHTEPVVVGGWTPGVPGPAPPTSARTDDDVALPTLRALDPLAGRLGLPSAGAVGLVVVAVLAVLVALGWGWYTRARPEVATARPVASGPGGAPAGFPSAAPSPASPTPVSRVVVDVAGRVRRPGLVRLPAGSRVADALRAAGGVRGHPDLTDVNLAALLVDGQQIVIGVGGAAAAPGATGGSAVPGQPVDLNSADVAGLDALPGIGPVLAQRIVDYRSAHGAFHDVGQLQDVTGIGPAKFADLRPLVRV